MTLDRNKLRELSMKVKNLPWRSEREAESPDIRDMEGTLLAMGIWPLHDPTPKAERQAEIQTYDIVEYLVLAANTAPALIDELEAAEANPQVGRCYICKLTIWAKQERMSDGVDGQLYHPLCKVSQRAEAAEQRVRELTQEVEVVRRGEAFASDSLFKQYQQSGECSRFTYSGWIGEQFRRLSVIETALRNLIEAAKCVRHWHCWGNIDEGMVVSSEAVRKLWAVRDEAEKALEGSNG